MTTEQELGTLRQMESLALSLAQSTDPLAASQYRLLHGRITALIAVLAANPAELSRVDVVL
jgi:hypothetical protein